MAMKESHESHYGGQATCQAQSDHVLGLLSQILHYKVLKKEQFFKSVCIKTTSKNLHFFELSLKRFVYINDHSHFQMYYLFNSIV